MFYGFIYINVDSLEIVSQIVSKCKVCCVGLQMSFTAKIKAQYDCGWLEKEGKISGNQSHVTAPRRETNIETNSYVFRSSILDSELQIQNISVAS